MSERRLVFISHPYKNNPAVNTFAVLKYARFCKASGMDPFVPILNYAFLEEDKDREWILDSCRFLLSRCDEIWVCSRKISDGMVMEIDEAFRLKKSVTLCDFHSKEKMFVLIPFPEYDWLEVKNA